MKRLIKKIMQDIRQIDDKNRQALVYRTSSYTQGHQAKPPIGFQRRSSHSYFVR